MYLSILVDVTLSTVMMLFLMFAQTTSMNVQSFIESRLERRAKGVFAPSGGKFLLCFLDDLNMPVSYMLELNKYFN